MIHEYEPGLVSVIIPTYNRAKLVTEATDSVLKQDYRPIELIVVDDGSTDDTQDVVSGWMKAKGGDGGLDVRFLRQEHRGAPSARNLGLIESKGEFIQFLDSDCELCASKVANQVSILNSHSDISHCYCITEFVNSKRETAYLLGEPPAEDPSVNAVVSFGFTTIAPLWRRRVLHAVGPWDEDLACRQDWVYRSRILLQFGPGIFVSDIWCLAKLHDGERVSQHGTLQFALGMKIAINKVGDWLSNYHPYSKTAKNSLATEMMAVFKTFLYLQKYEEAGKALYDASSLASGKMLLRLKLLRSLWLTLGPRGFPILMRIRRKA